MCVRQTVSCLTQVWRAGLTCVRAELCSRSRPCAWAGCCALCRPATTWPCMVTAPPGATEAPGASCTAPGCRNICQRGKPESGWDIRTGTHMPSPVAPLEGAAVAVLSPAGPARGPCGARPGSAAAPAAATGCWPRSCESSAPAAPSGAAWRPSGWRTAAWAGRREERRELGGRV